jgi:hypothetical protein
VRCGWSGIARCHRRVGDSIDRVDLGSGAGGGGPAVVARRRIRRSSTQRAIVAATLGIDIRQRVYRD